MVNRILFYNSGGGIGDAIQILPLIDAVKKEFKNSRFYYLCAHENHFNSTLKDFNSKIETLDLNIKYFGFRWWHLLAVKRKIKRNNIEKFDLIIDLQSKIRNSLILRMIPHKTFISQSFNFLLTKPKIKLKKNVLINNNILDAINHISKTNCIISEYNLNKINNKLKEESTRLLPNNNYIGFSITQGNIYRKKEWPLNNIILICKKLKEKNMIPVFFVEKRNKEIVQKIKNLVPESLFPEHETKLSSPALVTCLGQRLNFAISIDNGIMHMLSLSKTPMIILFGPTNPKKFAPSYQGAIVLDSKKLYKTTDISSISSEDVLLAARQHLNF